MKYEPINSVVVNYYVTNLTELISAWTDAQTKTLPTKIYANGIMNLTANITLGGTREIPIEGIPNVIFNLNGYELDIYRPHLTSVLFFSPNANGYIKARNGYTTLNRVFFGQDNYSYQEEGTNLLNIPHILIVGAYTGNTGGVNINGITHQTSLFGINENPNAIIQPIWIKDTSGQSGQRLFVDIKGVSVGRSFDRFAKVLITADNPNLIVLVGGDTTWYYDDIQPQPGFGLNPLSTLKPITSVHELRLNDFEEIEDVADEDRVLIQQGNKVVLAPKTSVGGATNYADLTSKPSINSVELSGNKTASQLGLEPAKSSDSNYVTDAEKAALHSHSNKEALDNVSGVNTGDQDLSGLVEKIDNHSLVLDTEIAKLATIEEYAEPNDPNTVIDANYVHTDNNYTDMDKTLLSTALQSESDPVYALDKDRLANTSGTNTGDETTETIKTKLGISILSGSNTGDQDLSGYATVNHNHNLADLNEKSYNSLSDKPPIPSIVGLMKEVDYTGETGLQQVNYAKYAEESEQAIQAYSAQQDGLGRKIHETYALKQSGVTPPETTRVILDNINPHYIISEITADNLIVQNIAAVGGEVIAPTLASDKVLKITIQGNDTMLNGSTYEDGVTIFAIYEASTETWTFTSILDPEVPDYSDMTVDIMLENPTVLTSIRNGILVGRFIDINKTVFIRTHSTAIGIYQCMALYSGNAYLEPIAAGTALHTVRVKDGDVWYSQYDGKNAETLLFERITVEKLAITKQGYNGEISPVVYPVDRQRTVIGYKLGSNATDFSVTINSVNYTKADVTNVVVPVNTEIKINDVTIAVGKNTGNVVLILK